MSDERAVALQGNGIARALWRLERGLGTSLRVLVFAAGLAAVWATQQDPFPRVAMVGLVLYFAVGLAVAAWTLSPRAQHLSPAAFALLVGFDACAITFLIAHTGGPRSELYLLYLVIALKTALGGQWVFRLAYVPFAFGPLYLLGAYLGGGSFLFAITAGFLIRYILLYGFVVGCLYLAGHLAGRGAELEQVSRSLDDRTAELRRKTQSLTRTATDLGDRVLQLRSLQEGIKAINSAVALENLLQMIVANASQVLRGVRCSVGLFDEVRNEVATMAASGVPRDALWGSRFRLGAGVAGWVVQQSRPALIGDAAGDPRFVRVGQLPLASIVSVPLVSDGRAIGALSATSPERDTFSADDLTVLSAFADQASIAVRKARLYEGIAHEKQQAERSMQQVMALNQVAGALVSTLNLEETLSLIIRQLLDLSKATHCAVSLLDEPGAELVGKTVSGLDERALGAFRFRLEDEPASAMALRESRTVVVAQAPASSVPEQRRISELWGIATYLVAPLVAKGRPIGAIYLADARPERSFDEAQVELATSFANFAATAIENAQLYEHVRDKSTQLEAVLNGIGDGVIVTDPELDLVMMNPVAEHMFDLASALPPGVALRALVRQEPLLEQLGEALLSTGGAVAREIVVPMTRDHGEMVYQSLAASLTGDDGKSRGVVTVLRDITSQKQLEKMKSNFLSVVSHELKTPLHSIRGFVDIILMGKTGKLNDTQTDFLGTVKEQTVHLQNLINDLLEYSRLESGQVRLRVEEFSLAEMAETVVGKLGPQAQEAQLELSVSLHGDFGIEADRMRMEQVLTNLVDNAIKFTPAGGSVRIGGEDLGDRVRVTVTDSGIGIPPAEREKVFERFYQVDSGASRPYRGQGLGLSICKHIVEHHRGRIWVDAGDDGQGSAFVIVLPKRLDANQPLTLDFSRLPNQDPR
jgi:PAS domain S-box-containing protein